MFITKHYNLDIAPCYASILMNIRQEIENITAVAEMKMEGNRPEGLHTFRLADTVGRGMAARALREENDKSRRSNTRCMCNS